MKLFNKFLLAAILAGVTIQSSFAALPSKYRCKASDGTQTMNIDRVGLGEEKTNRSERQIIFCRKSDRYSCYATDYDIYSDIGRATYANLLTAYSLGKDIRFYCKENGWVENVHMLSDS